MVAGSCQNKNQKLQRLHLFLQRYSFMYSFLKRTTDLFLSITAIVFLLPLLVPIVFLLLCTGEREVFYRQRRIGQNGKPFWILKFATMLRNSAEIGTKEITLRNDPRVTPVGRFLRKTKLNELPQLLNVLTGEMSMVGPRPLMEVSYQLYTPEQQTRIYESKPGITGIGSIVFRDEEKLVSDAKDPRAAYQNIFSYKAELEIWYRSRASWALDGLILLVTAWSVLVPNTQLPHRLWKDLPQKSPF
jgi:lipopolysaccharide/colanic/teichoic acid biosynthesis glycosyltransferase